MTLHLPFDAPAGCPHLGIECAIAQVNKLLMHYGCPSNLGLKYRASLEFMSIEMGVSDQPLQESYRRYQDRVTHSWLKSLWEKCDLLDIWIEFNDVKLSPPRSRDKWLMREFYRLGYDSKALARLNRVRLHQQVLFLSDILGASGKELDQRYLHKRPSTEQWSTLSFPKEKPPRKDFRLWEQAIQQLVPSGGLQDRLGVFEHASHKIWEWQFDEEAGRLYHSTQQGIALYKRSTQTRYANMPNRWELDATAAPSTAAGKVCSI